MDNTFKLVAWTVDTEPSDEIREQIEQICNCTVLLEETGPVHPESFWLSERWDGVILSSALRPGVVARHILYGWYASEPGPLVLDNGKLVPAMDWFIKKYMPDDPFRE